MRKQKLYGDDSYPGQLQCQSLAGDRGPVAGVGGRVGKSGKFGISHGKSEGHVVYASVNCVCNVCGSAHSCGCVVNGTFARAVLLLVCSVYKLSTPTAPRVSTSVPFIFTVGLLLLLTRRHIILDRTMTITQNLAFR